jgi:RimJ/RimL family protein N-acetyltransferase
MSKYIASVILATERLILRTWKDSDTRLMTAINSDPAVMEYFPSVQGLAATKILMRRINQHHEKFGYSIYEVERKDNNEFIGFVGLNHPDFKIPHFKPKGQPIVEIGWR